MGFEDQFGKMFRAKHVPKPSTVLERFEDAQEEEAPPPGNDDEEVAVRSGEEGVEEDQPSPEEEEQWKPSRRLRRN